MSTSIPATSAPISYSPPATSSAPARAAWTSEPVIESLRQTRPWVLFFSILGFLCSALMFVMFLFALGEAARLASKPIPFDDVEMVIRGITVGLLGVLYVYPSLYLWRFARSIRVLTETHQLADLEAALRVQKTFWKFCGIAVSLVLAFEVMAGILAALLLPWLMS